MYKTDSVFCLDFEQFRLKGKKCTDFKYVQIHAFLAIKRFVGVFARSNFAEIFRTYLNKHFGVKIISIGHFVCNYVVLEGYSMTSKTPKPCLFHDVATMTDLL